MKYLYIIFLIIILSSGCIDDSEYEIRDEHRKFITELKEEYDNENVSKPFNEIQVHAVQRYDNYISVSGTVEIYNKTGYPFTPITEIDIKYGIGNIEFYERNYSVFSYTDYYTVFNGWSDFYDMWYLDKEYAPLPHHVLTSDSIPAQLVFDDIMKVGRFAPQDHQLINLNNQTSFKFNVGILDPQGAVKNPVVCFLNDVERPFEGNEFIRYDGSRGNPVNLERVSGADLNTPNDITDVVNDCYCIPLGNRLDDNGNRWIHGGSYTQFVIDFNVIRSDRLDENDIMYAFLDDLDNYLGKDIMHSTKADPVHIATIIGGK